MKDKTLFISFLSICFLKYLLCSSIQIYEFNKRELLKIYEESTGDDLALGKNTLDAEHVFHKLKLLSLCNSNRNNFVKHISNLVCKNIFLSSHVRIKEVDVLYGDMVHSKGSKHVEEINFVCKYYIYDNSYEIIKCNDGKDVLHPLYVGFDIERRRSDEEKGASNHGDFMKSNHLITSEKTLSVGSAEEADASTEKNTNGVITSSVGTHHGDYLCKLKLNIHSYLTEGEKIMLKILIGLCIKLGYKKQILFTENVYSLVKHYEQNQLKDTLFSLQFDVHYSKFYSPNDVYTIKSENSFINDERMMDQERGMPKMHFKFFANKSYLLWRGIEQKREVFNYKLRELISLLNRINYKARIKECYMNELYVQYQEDELYVRKSLSSKLTKQSAEKTKHQNHLRLQEENKSGNYSLVEALEHFCGEDAPSFEDCVSNVMSSSTLDEKGKSIMHHFLYSNFLCVEKCPPNEEEINVFGHDMVRKKLQEYISQSSSLPFRMNTPYEKIKDKIKKKKIPSDVLLPRDENIQREFFENVMFSTDFDSIKSLLKDELDKLNVKDNVESRICSIGKYVRYHEKLYIRDYQSRKSRVLYDFGILRDSFWSHLKGGRRWNWGKRDKQAETNGEDFDFAIKNSHGDVVNTRAPTGTSQRGDKHNRVGDPRTNGMDGHKDADNNADITPPPLIVEPGGKEIHILQSEYEYDLLRDVYLTDQANRRSGEKENHISADSAVRRNEFFNLFPHRKGHYKFVIKNVPTKLSELFHRSGNHGGGGIHPRGDKGREIDPFPLSYRNLRFACSEDGTWPYARREVTFFKNGSVHCESEFQNELSVRRTPRNGNRSLGHSPRGVLIKSSNLRRKIVERSCFDKRDAPLKSEKKKKPLFLHSESVLYEEEEISFAENPGVKSEVVGFVLFRDLCTVSYLGKRTHPVNSPFLGSDLLEMIFGYCILHGFRKIRVKSESLNYETGIRTSFIEILLNGKTALEHLGLRLTKVAKISKELYYVITGYTWKSDLVLSPMVRFENNLYINHDIDERFFRYVNRRYRNMLHNLSFTCEENYYPYKNCYDIYPSMRSSQNNLCHFELNLIYKELKELFPDSCNIGQPIRKCYEEIQKNIVCTHNGEREEDGCKYYNFIVDTFIKPRRKTSFFIYHNMYVQEDLSKKSYPYYLLLSEVIKNEENNLLEKGNYDLVADAQTHLFLNHVLQNSTFFIFWNFSTEFWKRLRYIQANPTGPTSTPQKGQAVFCPMAYAYEFVEHLDVFYVRE
ncbi:hypothetical protein C922_00576 [Plasmodium inui San Antonio 1]|uniref:Uncharacterized protein n=1 Tax=Plasmodium inui San Antonio 1 TaxID=1237626 RepID=W7AC41_9APIC|nr:hypothetical protein C922_00576 [Plasmodium inui San Antonio 1]EUD68888.1 hypothetical protein C922_00576 [Plasmodium inui San Antonio 1]